MRYYAIAGATSVLLIGSMMFFILWMPHKIKIWADQNVTLSVVEQLMVTCTFFLSSYWFLFVFLIPIVCFGLAVFFDSKSKVAETK
jgi:type II secretory pathway component PulF